MKNKFTSLLLASLLLVGCGETVTSSSKNSSQQGSQTSEKTPSSSTTQVGSSTPVSSTIKESVPQDVPDSELAKTEENFILYDNKIVMEQINGSREVPDPFIYRFNGWYYLYPTTNGRRQKAYKSQDLYNWELVSNGVLQDGLVYDYNDDAAPPSAQTPFAPEVIYYNGMFYMISSPNGQGHYIFESESPEGPFYAITDNIGRNIDGSFFIDNDEEIYMFGASSGAIVAYGLEEDFTTFITADDGVTPKQNLLTNCKVGGWNEGPYLLQRNGEYYMTYCGSHYLSASYRVDYAYAKEGSNLFSSSAYTREDTVLVATEDDFKGLGHSATVLAPDMDSYVIGYHNLNNDTSRNLCLSRLSFNGSMMVANSVKKENAVGVDLPPFYAEDDSELTSKDGMLLSDVVSEDTFTAEFNVVGEGKMIFSYIDKSNYSYIEYKDNKIKLHTVENGTDSVVHEIALINEYDTSVYHTFRIQHRDGLVNLYFDSMEKAHSIPLTFKGGKIGYLASNSFDEIGYTAFSNVARGSSDNEYYADTVSLANGFDEKLSFFKNGYEYYTPNKTNFVQENNPNIVLKTEGDHATYRMYAAENENYNINIRIPSKYLGKTYGVRIDDGKINEVKLDASNLKYEKGDVYLSLGEYDLSDGCHNISIYNVGDEIAFSQLRYEVALYESELDLEFNSSTSLDDLHTYGVSAAMLTDDGLDSEDQDLQAVVTDYEYNDYYAETEITINDMQSTGIAGLMFNVTDFSKNYKGDGDGGGNANMFRGYRLSIQPGTVYLELIDFNFGRILKSKSFKYSMGETYTLSVEVNGNEITCYLDLEELFTITSNVGNLNGKVGVVAADCDTLIKSLRIS